MLSKVVDWEIVLPNKLPFARILVHCRHFANQKYAVEWVDTDRFIPLVEAQRHRDPKIVIPEAMTWLPCDWEKMLHFLENSSVDGSIEMPVVSFNAARQVATSAPKLFGLLPTGGTRNIVYPPYVGFVNGRHRTRAFERLGIKSFPVEIDVGAQQLLKQACGSMSQPAPLAPRSLSQA